VDPAPFETHSPQTNFERYRKSHRVPLSPSLKDKPTTTRTLPDVPILLYIVNTRCDRQRKPGNMRQYLTQCGIAGALDVAGATRFS
jgi:hypothetical protein